MAPRHLCVRESSGKHFTDIEDAIILQNLEVMTPTRDFIHLLPGRTTRSVDSRINKLRTIHKMDIPSRRIDEQKRKRFLYVPGVLDDALMVFAEDVGMSWTEFVITAIEEKIARDSEKYLAAARKE